MPDASAIVPTRPSDAIRAAMDTMAPANANASRLDSYEVRLLMALRALGWDVTRRAGNGSRSEPRS